MMKKLAFLALMSFAGVSAPAFAYNYHWSADFNQPTLDPNLVLYNGTAPGQNSAYSYTSGGGQLVLTGNQVPGGGQDIYTKFALAGDFLAQVTVDAKDAVNPANVVGVLQAVHTGFGSGANMVLPNRWFTSILSAPTDFFTGAYDCTWDSAGVGPTCQFPNFPNGTNFAQPWGNAPVTFTLERLGDTISASYNFIGSDTIYNLASFTGANFAQPTYMDLFASTQDPGSTIGFSNFSIDYDAAVPEPGTTFVFLTGLGLLALGMRGRARNGNSAMGHCSS